MAAEKQEWSCRDAGVSDCMLATAQKAVPERDSSAQEWPDSCSPKTHSYLRQSSLYAFLGS